MPEWTALGVPGNDRPHALLSPEGKRYDAPRDPASPPPDVAREMVIDLFMMADEQDAISHFLNLVKHGTKAAHPVYRSITKGRLWRPRGTPHYLNNQSMRLRIPQVITDRSRDNKELYRLNSIMPSLADKYHSARKEDCVAVLSGPEKAAVKGSLAEAEKSAAQLHACAAAAHDMIDEAYQAFGIEIPAKPFWVVSIYDTLSQPHQESAIPTATDEPAQTSEPPKSSPPTFNHPGRNKQPAGVKA